MRALRPISSFAAQRNPWFVEMVDERKRVLRRHLPPFHLLPPPSSGRLRPVGLEHCGPTSLLPVTAPWISLQMATLMPEVERGAKRLRSQSPAASASLQRHDVLWFGDGTIILCAESMCFRVHRDVLCLQSGVFKDMFSLPPDVAGNDTEDGCPVVRLHDKPHDVENMLLAIYHRRCACLLKFEQPQLTDQLKCLLDRTRRIRSRHSDSYSPFWPWEPST